MIVNEIFESIQGEGRHAGEPMVFVRLSGCNLTCDFCDTEYHTQGDNLLPEEVARRIENIQRPDLIVCWTGGEPMLQKKEIKEVIKLLHPEFKHHLEINATMLDKKFFDLFEYVAFSPKNYKNCVDLWFAGLNLRFLKRTADIKVVTDLKIVGTDMLKGATILMPLTTFDKRKDKRIAQGVWVRCVEEGLIYSPRLQIDVWGKKRGV